MRGREFLRPARDAAAGSTEAYWRTAVVDAYYALLLECRDAMFSWGRSLPRGQSVHSWVRITFWRARDADLKDIAIRLDRLGNLRSKASYDLALLPAFTSANTAWDAIQDAADGIAILDRIDGDPARRQAAIASLPPP